jgi:hypothetical protein
LPQGRRTLLNLGNRIRYTLRVPQRVPVVGHRTRRRAAAMPELDIIAAGISLLISELRQRLP